LLVQVSLYPTLPTFMVVSNFLLLVCPNNWLVNESIKKKKSDFILDIILLI